MRLDQSDGGNYEAIRLIGWFEGRTARFAGGVGNVCLLMFPCKFAVGIEVG
jgi:hypothetical protein